MWTNRRGQGNAQGVTSARDDAPDYLARASEQLGGDATPAGQQKRHEDLALMQELTTAKPPLRMLRPTL